MSDFTALPVGKGDAFLWKDEGRIVLVDGGQASKSCLGELRRRGVTHIDVMVCTHGDSDHWRGLLAVLDDPTVTVDELWVPARWGDGLKELATDPIQVLEQLFDECRKLQPGTSIHNVSTDGWVDDDDHDLAEVEEAVAAGPDLSALLVGVVTWLHPWFPHSAHGASTWYAAVQIAGGIWEIVRKALVRGIVIRWFKYGLSPAGGKPWLYAANAAETLKVRRTKSIFRWIALTLKNSEALVVVGSANGAPPILFCSDSDLQFDLKVVPRAHMLVTAPHHGAESNSAAYGCLSKHADFEHLWIRSDGNSRTRPGSSFRSIPSQFRSCTTCSQCPRARQVVEAEVANGRWILKSKACPR